MRTHVLVPPAEGPRGLVLLVLTPTGPFTHPLPRAGRVTIGRGEADVSLVDNAVSGLHALIAIEAGKGGTTLTLQDLGSTNGTIVGGRRLASGEQAALALGESFQVGQSLLIAHAEEGVPRPRRYLPHGYFEARLEEECLRQEERREKRPLAVARLHVAGPDAEERFARAALKHVRPYDVFARFSPQQFELLMTETSAEQATQLVRTLADAVSDGGAPVATGLAFYPQDAQSAHALMAVAGERVRGGRGGGAAIVVEGRDPPMQELMRKLSRAAAGNSTVLLVGETGTGKSFLAERLHQLSPRASHPFVACDCGAISKDVIESELFGHARGAFTGAVSARNGLMHAADGGTLFLDEIAELPLGQQVKLLTVLDKKQVRRVGEDRAQQVDFRLIAATSRDLGQLVRAGAFREELFFRINVIRLRVPPLRERPSEILPLAEAFLTELAGSGPRPSLAPETAALLTRYPWPGNVRELRHALERAVAQGGEMLLPEDFELESEDPSEPPAPAGRIDPSTISRDQLMDVLLANGCNRTRAAAALGRSREWLRQKCIELGIPLGR